MSVFSRLAALERSGGQVCPACGWPRERALVGVRLVVNLPAVFERLTPVASYGRAALGSVRGVREADGVQDRGVRFKLMDPSVRESE